MRSRTPDTLADRMIRSWPQAGLLGELRRAHRGLDHRLDHHVAGVGGLGEAGVRLHELGQQLLVERSPVDADPDGLVVLDRGPDDRLEVLVVLLRPDVARVDPVLVERRRHRRVVDQQLVAVVVEVADDRRVDAQVVAQLADHLRHGRGGGVRVDGHADELRAGVGEAGDLDGRRVGVGRVRVGHGLDDDRVRGPDEHAADVDRHRRPPRAAAACRGSLGAAHLARDVEHRDPDQEREQRHEADRVGQLLRAQRDLLAEARDRLEQRAPASGRRRGAGRAGSSPGRGSPTGSRRRTASSRRRCCGTRRRARSAMPTGPETGGAWVGFSTIELAEARAARRGSGRTSAWSRTSRSGSPRGAGGRCSAEEHELEAVRARPDAEGALAGRDLLGGPEGGLDLRGRAVRRGGPRPYGLSGQRPELVDRGRPVVRAEEVELACR